MEQKHTPLPWQLEMMPTVINNTDEAATIWKNNQTNGSALLATVSRSPGDEQAIANARLIVRSVNNHQKFIDALKESILQIEYMQEKFGETGTGNAIISRSRSLLHSLETETE